MGQKGNAMKSPIRFNKASGSTRRRIERIVANGEHALKRAGNCAWRRQLVQQAIAGAVGGKGGATSAK